MWLGFVELLTSILQNFWYVSMTDVTSRHAYIAPTHAIQYAMPARSGQLHL